jgi:hypothetical protein
MPILLLISILLVILAIYIPASEHFYRYPATFWDGIWHGMLAPWSLWPPYRIEPAQSTGGYDWGVGVGAVVTIVCIIVIYNFLNNNGSGCLVGLLGGYIGGALGGTITYWLIYFLLSYVLQNINFWLGWLIGGYERNPATFWDGLDHGVIAPWYLLLSWLAKPALSTSGYLWGVIIGGIWTSMWIIGVSILSIRRFDGSIKGWLFGLFGGYFAGILSAGTIYGVLALITYLIMAVRAWLDWLVGVE